MSFDICCRILFSVAEILSHLKSISEVHAVVDHLAENEVCSTVEDTCDTCYVICCKALVKRSDYRNSTADTCLEEEIAVLLLCNCKKFSTFLCNKFLIWCWNALALLKACLYEIVSECNTAHALGNNCNFVIIQNVVDILGELVTVRTSGKVSDVENILDISIWADFLQYAFLVLIEKFNNTWTNCTVTENCYFRHK